MALLDDILAAAQKKNQYTTNTGDNNIDALGNRYNSDYNSGVNQLYTKYNTDLTDYNNQLAPIQQNIAAVPAKYQPQYDNNAVTEQTDLKRAKENAANYGQLGGGAFQQWQLDASGNRQNADSKVSANKNSDLQSYNNQLNDVNSKINTLNSNGESDLASLISQYNDKYNSDVLTTKQQEAAAAETAREKQASLDNAYSIAQLNKSPATKTSDSVLTNAVKNYTNQTYTVDGNGYKTGTTNTVSDPDALINYIASSGLSTDEQDQLIASYPYQTSGGYSLADYMQNKIDTANNQNSRTSQLQQSVGRGRTQ